MTRPATGTDDLGLTRVDRHDTAAGPIWVKRDDLYSYGGLNGGKVRTCARLVDQAARRHAPGVVTAGASDSPQVEIVARVARLRGLQARCHTAATADPTPAQLHALDDQAELIWHRPGYNNVIAARARQDAADRHWPLIPFGMECAAAVEETAHQATYLPGQAPEPTRIVLAVCSGMTLAGILHAAHYWRPEHRPPILGIVVGADPTRRLNRWAPAWWPDRVTLQPAGSRYQRPAHATLPDGTPLDPHYEAKAWPYTRPGDLFWVVGHRLN